MYIAIPNQVSKPAPLVFADPNACFLSAAFFLLGLGFNMAVAVVLAIISQTICGYLTYKNPYWLTLWLARQKGKFNCAEKHYVA